MNTGDPRSVKPEFETGCQATFSIDSDLPLNENNPHYLSFDIASENRSVSLSNNGYDGIPLKKGERYEFSAFIRGNPEYSGEITVLLTDAKRDKIAEASLGSAFGAEWEKYSVEFEIPEDYGNGRLLLTMKGAGEVCLDMISLFPEENWNGMRVDLLKMLEELKPGFVRFPGGCLVEGDRLENAYRWKDTIGPIEERKANYNLWGYHQSYGIGFFEYLLLSEHQQSPYQSFNSGMSCQVREPSTAPIDEMDEWIENVLDLRICKWAKEFTLGNCASSLVILSPSTRWSILV